MVDWVERLRELADSMEERGVKVTFDDYELETIEIAPDAEGWSQCRTGPRRKFRIHWEWADVEPAGQGERSTWTEGRIAAEPERRE